MSLWKHPSMTFIKYRLENAKLAGFFLVITFNTIVCFVMFMINIQNPIGHTTSYRRRNNVESTS